MVECSRCGASFENKFNYCPNCGKAKSEVSSSSKPASRSAAKKFEEATLKIDLSKREPITEYPFDWRPNILLKLFGESDYGWTEISFFKFILIGIHPVKGKYVAFESKPFRGFYVPNSIKPIRFPTPLKNMLNSGDNGRKWVENLFLEREEAWEQFNRFLIKQSWEGLTQDAINRYPPFEIHPDPVWVKPNHTYWVNMDSYLIIGMNQNQKFDKLGFFGNTRGTPICGGDVEWKSFSKTE